jgi:predicted RNA-binding Zn-ribbon protein involved in translation (DUF1610 family)
MEKIRWAPKVRQEKVWRLYQSEAGGFLDEELLDKLGYALLERCEHILMIDEGQAACPRCGAIFFVRSPETKGSAEPVPCPTPGCGWQVSGEEYDLSIRHRELHSGKAIPAFAAYLAAFPKAKTPQERMLAIDQLIHAFHWDLKLHLPNRPAANNLIEGSLEQVIDLLDRLSYGDDGQAQQEWLANMASMLKRRKGER